MLAEAAAQPTHPEIVILRHGGLHHAHSRRSCCAYSSSVPNNSAS
jgi:hypothetical protein